MPKKKDLKAEIKRLKEDLLAVVFAPNSPEGIIAAAYAKYIKDTEHLFESKINSLIDKGFISLPNGDVVKKVSVNGVLGKINPPSEWVRDLINKIETAKVDFFKKFQKEPTTIFLGLGIYEKIKNETPDLDIKLNTICGLKVVVKPKLGENFLLKVNNKTT